MWQALLLLVFWIDHAHSQVNDAQVDERAKRLTEILKHDGIERVVVITKDNFKSYTKRNRLIILFHSKEDSKKLKQEKHFLEVIAMVFHERDVVVGICNVIEYPDIAKKAGVRFAGVIRIFNFGKILDYEGQRSVDVFAPFISKMLESPLTEINSKTSKRQFDTLDLPKVVAFVEKGSQELAQFTKAARAFQPMVPFFVVYNSKLAKSLHLKKLNSIQLIKPYERSVSYGKQPFQEEHIVNFLNKNKKQVMQKLRLENLYGVWAADNKGYLIPVFAETSSKEGERFFSLAKQIAREYSENQLLQFVWIDPKPFPAMREHWQFTFGIDPMKPSLGAVDVSKQTSTWLQMSSQQSDISRHDIKQWVEDLLQGKLELKPLRKAPVDKDAGESPNKGLGSKDEL